MAIFARNFEFHSQDNIWTALIYEDADFAAEVEFSAPSPEDMGMEHPFPPEGNDLLVERAVAVYLNK